jgi:hypothetical protein
MQKVRHCAAPGPHYDPSMLKSVTATFERFAASEQGSSRLLLACTVVALVAANSFLGAAWLGFWHAEVAGLTLELWVNDALMAVFFLLIGLELERELMDGELSDFRRAILPVIAAVGGMVAPALVHYAFNAGTPTGRGFGIPMATDIAFALGVLALLGKRVPFALRVFVVAFAVMDDLGAIIVIALFYSSQLSPAYLGGAIAVWAALFALGRVFRVMALTPYVLAGAVLWFLMLKSGVPASSTRCIGPSPSSSCRCSRSPMPACCWVPANSGIRTASASSSACCWASRSASCCSRGSRLRSASAACPTDCSGSTWLEAGCSAASASRCRSSSRTWLLPGTQTSSTARSSPSSRPH